MGHYLHSLVSNPHIHYNPPMHIASCTIQLELYGIGSLKEKRQILKSLLTRLPQQLNVAVAEVGHQDAWNSAIICVVTVGTDRGRLHSTLERAVAFIERQRPDAPIADYAIQFH